MPEPTILVINQDMDTTDFCRQSVNMLFEAWLGMDGHEFKVVKSVREVTPEQYAQWDCVLAHVNMSELRELEQLALSHPEVGLIYTTGEGIAPELGKELSKALGAGEDLTKSQTNVEMQKLEALRGMQDSFCSSQIVQ